MITGYMIFSFEGGFTVRRFVAKRKKFVFMCAVLSFVLLFVSCLAQPAGNARTLVDAAVSLLFSTDNVTLTGSVDFALDGERFKTAEIMYKQAGVDSYWDLVLKSPREYRSDRETGYTIIANDGVFSVMERYHPGIYSDGSDVPCDTLVRRSTRSDTLVSAGRAVADQLELLLPAGTFIASETADGGQLIKVKLAREDVPGILNPFLNLAADFAIRRFMDVDYDTQNETLRAYYAENSETVTQRILRTTTSFELADADFSVSFDTWGRFTRAKGSAAVLISSDTSSGTPLSVTFDYGATRVDAFDPAEYDVIPAGTGPEKTTEIDPALTRRLTDRSIATLAAAGYDPSFLAAPEINEADGLYYVAFPGYGDFDIINTALNEQGDFLLLGDGSEQWYMSNALEPSAEELPAEAVNLLHTFLQEGFPALAEQCVSFRPCLEYNWDGNTWAYVTALDPNGADLPYSFYVRLTAPLKVVCYDCLSE